MGRYGWQCIIQSDLPRKTTTGITSVHFLCITEPTLDRLSRGSSSNPPFFLSRTYQLSRHTLSSLCPARSCLFIHLCELTSDSPFGLSHTKVSCIVPSSYISYPSHVDSSSSKLSSSLVSTSDFCEPYSARPPVAA